MIDNESSTRLDLLRFPLIIGVVFIHAYETSVGFSTGVTGVTQNAPLVDLIRNTVSQGIARTAVPLFFLMSGYLFFKNRSFDKIEYIEKLKSRSKTLLIPFLFWNILTLALIAMAQNIPVTQQFFSGKNALISSFQFSDYINAIFGVTRSPISYQFWFIRDLIALVLLTPLIFILCKRIPILYTTSILFLWALPAWPFSFPSAEAILFFSIGASLSINNASIFSLDPHGKKLASLYAIALTLDISYIHSESSQIIHKIGICLGVATFLYLTKHITPTKKLKSNLIALSGSSFFVFAAHEPLLTISRKLSYRLIEPNSTWTILSLYFIIPIFVISILVLSHRFLLKIAPTFTRTITGGR